MDSETKLVLVGDGGVGKSTLVKKLLNGNFEQGYVPTLGIEVYPWRNYVIWDTAGQDKFGGLRSGYYIEAKKAIIMVDATSKLTSRSIKYWYDLLLATVPNVEVYILVNKMDVQEVKQEVLTKAREFASNNNCKYMEISCKLMNNVNNLTCFLRE